MSDYDDYDGLTTHICNVCGGSERYYSVGSRVCPWCGEGVMHPEEDDE